MAQLEHRSAPKTVPGIQGFICQAQDNLVMALDAIIESHMIQTHHANKEEGSPDTGCGGVSVPIYQKPYLA